MADPPSPGLSGPAATRQQRHEATDLAWRAFLAAHRAHPLFSPWPLIIAVYAIEAGALAGFGVTVLGGPVPSPAAATVGGLGVACLAAWSCRVSKHRQFRRDLAAAQRIETAHAGGATAIAAFTVDRDAGTVTLHLVAAHGPRRATVTAALRALRRLLDEADRHELTVHTYAVNRRLAATYQRLYGFAADYQPPVWSHRRYWHIPIHRAPRVP